MTHLLRAFIFACCVLFGSSLHAQQAQLEVAFPNLSFNLAVDLQNAGDGTDRLFAVEQGGIIRVFQNEAMVANAQIFLDIRNRVLANDRFGLLGLAFHPNFENNGFFYLHYNASNPQRSVISRFTVSANDPNRADPGSEFVILEVEQPHRFHNGGQLAFGPDGMLYISFGDGGPGRDPNNHGQNRETLLGTMLRIDVDQPDPGHNYGIPGDNPFAGNSEGWREEIWAWGLRNTWRFSFDPVTGLLWGGENGEDRWEEINIIRKGKNYGWKIVEGSSCFSPPAGCDTAGLEPPVWLYGGNSLRRSVIGGFIYRGSRNPELAGSYIYGDFLRGNIWSLTIDSTGRADNRIIVSGFNGIGTFGLDEDDELLISNINDGRIYRFVSTISTVTAPHLHTNGFELHPAYPNPFQIRNGRSLASPLIRFHLQRPAEVTLKLYNTLGQEVVTLVDGFVGQGVHEFRLKPESLSPGIYFYRLESEGETLTRKLSLLAED